MSEQISQIIRETITELIDDSRCIYCGSITNEDLRKWFGGQIWFRRTETR